MRAAVTKSPKFTGDRVEGQKVLKSSTVVLPHPFATETMATACCLVSSMCCILSSMHVHAAWNMVQPSAKASLTLPHTLCSNRYTMVRPSPGGGAAPSLRSYSSNIAPTILSASSLPLLRASCACM